MGSTSLTSETFYLWRKTAFDLGLFGFLMAMAMTIAIIAPLLIFGESFIAMAILTVVALVGSLAYSIIWCAGYSAVNHYMRTEKFDLSPAFLTVSDRIKPLLGGMFLVWCISAMGGFLFMIPTVIVSAFSLVYLPFLTLERTGPIECFSDSLRSISENLVLCAKALGVLTLVVIISTAAIMGIGAAAVFTLSPKASMIAILVAMVPLIFFFFMPVYWIVGTLLYRRLTDQPVQPVRNDSSIDGSAALEATPDQEVPPDNGFIHKKPDAPAPAPITVDLDGDFLTPPEVDDQ